MSNISWKTLNDIKPYRIGIVRGYSYGDEFDNFKKQLKIDLANSDISNFKKLISERIDLLCIDYLVGVRLLKSKFTYEERSKIKLIIDPPIVSYGIHVVCDKTYDQCTYYLNEFNKGLKIITLNGTKQKIIDQSNF